MKTWYASGPVWDGRKGFGLIEQIVALLVLAVLVAIAVPSFRRMLDRYELLTAQTDYIAALQHARSIAVNEQANILFCPSRDALTCNDDNEWNGGWLIGRDPHNKKKPDGPPLYVGGKYSSRIDISGTAGRKYVQFQADGTTNTTNLTLLICMRGDNSHALKVIVAKLGRVRGAVADAADAASCVTPDQSRRLG